MQRAADRNAIVRCSNEKGVTSWNYDMKLVKCQIKGVLAFDHSSNRMVFCRVTGFTSQHLFFAPASRIATRSRFPRRSLSHRSTRGVSQFTNGDNLTSHLSHSSTIASNHTFDLPKEENLTLSPNGHLIINHIATNTNTNIERHIPIHHFLPEDLNSHTTTHRREGKNSCSVNT